jgi:hypothetical protein
MNRAERRRIDREIKKVIQSDGDNCNICRRPFQHNEKTFYGRSTAGTAVVLGECCLPRLEYGVGQGLYVGRTYDVLSGIAQPVSKKRKKPEDIEGAVDAFQTFFANVDAVADDASNRAGISTARSSVNVLPSLWKSDDAAWFAENRDRSHRLRPAFPGEAETLPSDYSDTVLPPRHEFQMLVRQVEPGQRIRTAFARNLDTPIPDIEPVIHALFDTMFSQRDPGAVISVEEVAKLAKLYVPGSTDS